MPVFKREMDFCKVRFNVVDKFARIGDGPSGVAAGAIM